MFYWKKKGKIFDPTKDASLEWMHAFSQAPSTLIFDNFVRVYFSCREKPDEQGRVISHCAYVDLSRKNLHEIIRVSQRPILELGKRGAFDEFGTYPCSVIRHDEKYLCYYAGRTRCESVPYDTAIGVAFSEDGEYFEKLGEGPVLSASLYEPFVISGPKIRRFHNKFYIYYIAGDRWRDINGKLEIAPKIRMAISQDGLDWKRKNKNLIRPVYGDDEFQGSPDVICYNGRYHMFFAYLLVTDFRRSQNQSYRIGYAYSDDGESWVRDDRKSGIGLSESGWDDGMISYPHVFELDDKIYMLYIGNEFGKYGFGLAELEGVLR